MITFLWMLYLAGTTLITIFDIILFTDESKNKEGYSNTIQVAIIVSILWSVWYFYFLH